MNSTKRNLLVGGVSAAAALAIAIPLMTPSQATTPTDFQTTEIAVQMDGAQETQPADPNGIGDAFFFANTSDPMALCYVLIVDRIGPAAAAHIHPGAVGVANPPVVELRAPTDGDSAACVQVRERLLARILNNPQNFYVNVHNARFPDGAIRGQLG
jgi:CHRD domain